MAEKGVSRKKNREDEATPSSAGKDVGPELAPPNQKKNI